MAWYDPSWLYRQKITIDHTLVAEDLTGFPVLITDAAVQASLFTQATADGADLVITGADGTTKLKRELVQRRGSATDVACGNRGIHPAD